MEIQVDVAVPVLLGLQTVNGNQNNAMKYQIPVMMNLRFLYPCESDKIESKYTKHRPRGQRTPL